MKDQSKTATSSTEVLDALITAESESGSANFTARIFDLEELGWDFADTYEALAEQTRIHEVQDRLQETHEVEIRIRYEAAPSGTLTSVEYRLRSRPDGSEGLIWTGAWEDGGDSVSGTFVDLITLADAHQLVIL